MLLNGNGVLGFLDGFITYPHNFEFDTRTVVNETVMSDAYKIRKIHDKALMTLITATLSTAALSCVIGCTRSKQMWTNLCERFTNMTRTNIVQVKIDFQNIKKGYESIDDYLQRIKDARDQLAIVCVVISEYNTIKSVIRGRENLVSLKELRYQLKAKETILDEIPKQVPFMSAIIAHTSRSVYDDGGTSGTKSVSLGSHFSGSSISQVPYSPMLNPYQPMPHLQQLPFSSQMTLPPIAMPQMPMPQMSIPS